jgi:hypothetical protein
VKVTIYEKATQSGVRQVRRILEATALRATLKAGMTEAAYQVLAILCHEESETIANLQYNYFPRRALNGGEIHVPAAQMVDEDGYVVDKVCLTHALNEERTEAMEEIKFLYEREKEAM